MNFIATRNVFKHETQKSVFSFYFELVLSVVMVLSLFNFSIDLLLFGDSVGPATWFHGVTLFLYIPVLIFRHRFSSWFKAQILISICIINLSVFLTSRLTSGNLWLYPNLHLSHKILMIVVHLVLSAGAVLILFRRVIEGRQTSPGTGMGNGRWMNLYVNKRISEGARQGFMIIFSVSNFRIINAVKGRLFGDFLIQTVASHLQSLDSGSIKTAHLSGMEFCIWAENITVPEIKQAIDTVKVRLNRTIEKRCRDVCLLINTSSTLYPRDGRTYGDLFSKAHMALERTLVRHDTRHVHYTPKIEDDMKAEYEFNFHIRKAVDNNEFHTAYQEKRSMDGMRIHSLEALARLNNDEAGIISPAEFIPQVHRLFLDVPFTLGMINNVLGDIPILSRLYGYAIKVAINIPPSFFLYPDLKERLWEMFTEANISPDRIVFEITEDLFIDGMGDFHNVLTGLREMGIEISLDDFGTGFSSLSYLQDLPIDELKIDKSFIDKLGSNEKSFILVKAICDIAESNDYTVVAEGVETPDQLELLKDTSCSLIQGYLYSRPKAIHELVDKDDVRLTASGTAASRRSV